MAAMFDTSSTSAPEASPGCDVLASLHGVIERQDAELKFNRTKIEALNFEIARLKHWRFGSSSESLDNSAQTVLFDLIVADTREEDAAAVAASPALPATPPVPPVQARRAVRNAFPADLPRIDHHPRNPGHPLRLRPGVQARGRRNQRAARLRARAVLRAAPHPRQVRLRVLPDDPLRHA